VPTRLTFYLPSIPDWAKAHFKLIRYILLLLALTGSHLASDFTFLLTRLTPQTTRLRLKQLKKPRLAAFPARFVAVGEGRGSTFACAHSALGGLGNKRCTGLWSPYFTQCTYSLGLFVLCLFSWTQEPILKGATSRWLIVAPFGDWLSCGLLVVNSDCTTIPAYIIHSIIRSSPFPNIETNT
jgi:hypothetical protein